jgi:hypothetical protein
MVKCTARTLGASYTNLPIVSGAKIEVLPLSASTMTMLAVREVKVWHSFMSVDSPLWLPDDQYALISQYIAKEVRLLKILSTDGDILWTRQTRTCFTQSPYMLQPSFPLSHDDETLSFSNSASN